MSKVLQIRTEEKLIIEFKKLCASENLDYSDCLALLIQLRKFTLIESEQYQGAKKFLKASQSLSPN